MSVWKSLIGEILGNNVNDPELNSEKIVCWGLWVNFLYFSPKGFGDSCWIDCSLNSPMKIDLRNSSCWFTDHAKLLYVFYSVWLSVL